MQQLLLPTVGPPLGWITHVTIVIHASTRARFIHAIRAIQAQFMPFVPLTHPCHPRGSRHACHLRHV
eukprot:4715373-Lingulodinium_polyedra.AAC.1